MGRRWGKSVLGGTLVMNVLRQHGHAAWVVPTYKNGRPLWRWVQRVCAPLAAAKMLDVSKAEQTVITSRGGFFGIYSGDNIDGIRSEAFDLVVVDEAARITEEARTDAIQPTLADRDGDEIDISTPRRKNWFFVEFKKALANVKDSMAWRAPSSANPNPNIRKAYALAKTRVPPKTFRQEWDAMFVEDGGEVFRRVRDQATLSPRASPKEGAQYVFGVDWGRSNDSTVISVIDAGTREMVFLDRFSDIGYEIQTARLKAAYEKWKPTTIVAEANSMGGPLVESLQSQGYPVQAFWTSNPLKTQIVGDLTLALELSSLKLLNDETLIGELEAYEEQKTPTGLITYNAPSGMHDDTVMATALAWYATSHSNPFRGL